MATDEISALVGKTLDEKYLIGRPIGAGGMGAVYRAEHVGTGRPVAVKTILSRLVKSSEALERFRREARAAGGLRHPNIVDVTDFGVAHVDENEIAYLVMEYLEGRTLRALLNEAGKLPPGVVVDLVEQVALALDAAHRAGIIHRDLKPDNIWLVPDARGGFVVRVLDFGIAKLREGGSENLSVSNRVEPEEARRWEEGMASDTADTVIRGLAEAATDPATLSRPIEDSTTAETAIRPDTRQVTTPALTVVGSTLGTPAYMSPEQSSGGSVSPQSDLYSLGVVIWEALVGRPLFDGNFAELVRKHCTEEASRVDQENRDLPKSLGPAVAKALEKDPADRYPSARAMAGSLRVAIEGPTIILRRSAILCLDHVESFTRISWKAALPALVMMVPFAALAFWSMELGPAGPFFLTVVGAVFWGMVTVRTHAAFAAVVDRLRTTPLKEVDVSEVFSRINQRIGLDKDAGEIRSVFGLLAFYTMCELRAPAGQGDLAFQVAFHEEIPPGQVKDRCARLSASTKRAYDSVRFVILASLLIAPVVEGYLLFSAGVLAGLHRGDALMIAFAAATLSLPIIAMVINPLMSSALTLLYFRARQANGEDVALSAVAGSRL